MHPRTDLEMLAHDVRGALAVLAVEAEAILGRAHSPEQAVAARRMMRAVDAIDLMCASGRPRDRVSGQPRSLSGVLDDLSAIVAAYPGRSGGWTVRLDADAELGWRAPLLLRALANLCLNAVRHSGVACSASVGVRCARSREGVVVEVRDDGPGLPEQVTEWLAGRLSDAPAGLGLLSAAACAREIGGRLELVRSDASGTVLRIGFPLTDAPAAPVGAGGRSGTGQSGAGRSERAVGPASGGLRPEDMSAGIGLVCRHWSELRRRRGRLPARADLDPGLFGPVGPNMWLVAVEREPLRFRCESVGEAVRAATLGAVRPGLSLEEIDTRVCDGHLHHRLAALVRTGEPDFQRGRPRVRHDPRAFGLERIALPLADDGRTIDGVLNATVYFWEEGQVPDPAAA
jgi:hypothetical protein